MLFTSFFFLILGFFCLFAYEQLGLEAAKHLQRVCFSYTDKCPCKNIYMYEKTLQNSKLILSRDPLSAPFSGLFL